jgi:hypothetical protein
MELDALSPLEKARAIGDHYEVEELVSQGKVVSVPAPTDVLVLERYSTFGGDYFYRKVRLLSGDFAGMAVWVGVTALSGGGVHAWKYWPHRPLCVRGGHHECRHRPLL